jgi:hypothetical protein
MRVSIFRKNQEDLKVPVPPSLICEICEICGLTFRESCPVGYAAGMSRTTTIR